MNHVPLKEDEVAVCPTCDKVGFHVNAPDAISGPGGCGYRYWCWECEEGFDEYNRRKKSPRGTGLHGLAARLAEADPDEVSRDA